jgi:hypothetical protein
MLAEEVFGEPFVANFNFMEGLDPCSVWLVRRKGWDIYGGSE